MPCGVSARPFTHERRLMYELTDVRKTFRKGSDDVQALAGVDLTIESGEFLAAQGPTGQGKSTLLLLLGGLDRPTSGAVMFEGRDLATLGEAELASLRATAFGFVFQTFNLSTHPGRRRRTSRAALVPIRTAAKERRDQALAMLDELGLRGPRRPPAVRALRRAAATRGDRPRTRQDAARAARRRADRQPRRADPRRDHRRSSSSSGRSEGVSPRRRHP